VLAFVREPLLRRALLPSTIALVAGCSLVTSLDGYSGGGGVVAATDGGSDAAVADGGSADAARPDAAPDAAPPTTYCASLDPKPRFCADFTDGKVVAVGTSTDFDTIRTNGAAAQPTLDTLVHVSPPASARFDVLAGTRSYLTRTFAGESPASLYYAMSMRVRASSVSTDLMEIRAGADEAAVYVTRAADGSLTLTESYADDAGSHTPSWALAAPMLADTWVRMEWRIDTNTGRMTIALDGTQVLDAVLDPVNAGPGLTLVGGCTDANGVASVWIDDVVADF
jgi:hypothetical protein